MPIWIIAAAIGSIAITALLTWQLYRMNKPMLDEAKRDRANVGDSGGDSGGTTYAGASDRHDSSHDGGSDGGGGDGGGD